jgi:hypothetical protein
MNKITQYILLVGFSLILLLTSACASSVSAESIAKTENEFVTGETKMDMVEDLPEPSENDSVLNPVLSEVEISGLLFMREEEKLAREVYLYFYDLWGSQVFWNIAQSEETHTNSILTLIERYELDDPAAETAPGEFINADLQTLYGEIIDQGSRSLQDALLVGAAIEEIDILDIESYAAQTDQEDIILVYENLIKGSRNHLRAFVKNLDTKTGIEYQPQYLSDQPFEAITASSTESGGSSGGWHGKP